MGKYRKFERLLDVNIKITCIQYLFKTERYFLTKYQISNDLINLRTKYF